MATTPGGHRILVGVPTKTFFTNNRFYAKIAISHNVNENFHAGRIRTINSAD